MQGIKFSAIEFPRIPIEDAGYTDPVTGTFGANLNTEIIQEQKVITGGIPAEFVGATGLISNVVTKSGSNTFHGSANYFFQNQDLVDAGNLLGRMALALGTKMNEQQRLGLDQTGAPGGDLFALGPASSGLPSTANTGGATVQIAIQTTPSSGSTALAASAVPGGTRKPCNSFWS